jgi:hypothetical protein
MDFERGHVPARMHGPEELIIQFHEWKVFPITARIAFIGRQQLIAGVSAPSVDNVGEKRGATAVAPKYYDPRKHLTLFISLSSGVSSGGRKSRRLFRAAGNQQELLPAAGQGLSWKMRICTGRTRAVGK